MAEAAAQSGACKGSAFTRYKIQQYSQQRTLFGHIVVRTVESCQGPISPSSGPGRPGGNLFDHNNLVHKYNTLAATGLPAVGRRDSRMEALTRAIGRSYPALQARPISPSSGPGLPGGNLFDHNNLNYVHRITFVTCLIIITWLRITCIGLCA